MKKGILTYITPRVTLTCSFEPENVLCKSGDINNIGQDVTELSIGIDDETSSDGWNNIWE